MRGAAFRNGVSLGISGPRFPQRLEILVAIIADHQGKARGKSRLRRQGDGEDEAGYGKAMTAGHRGSPQGRCDHSSLQASESALARTSLAGRIPRAIGI